MEAAQYGGPSGWTVAVQRFEEWFHPKPFWGVAITGYPNGSIRRLAVRVPDIALTEEEAIAKAMPALTEKVLEL